MRVIFVVIGLFVFTKTLGQSIDTSQYTILPIMKYPSAFVGSYKSSSLSPQEIDQIEQILGNSIRDYNHNLWTKYPKWMKEDSSQFVINLKNSNRQYIAVVNTKQEKEVWVNCFPKITYENGLSPNYSWKHDVVIVEDGGNSFFNAKINLSKKKCYDLFVNGR